MQGSDVLGKPRARGRGQPALLKQCWLLYLALADEDKVRGTQPASLPPKKLLQRVSRRETAMHVRWEHKRDHAEKPVGKEYVGTVAHEPSIRIEVTPWIYSVRIDGVLAHERRVEEHMVERATRRRKKPVAPEDLAKEMATAWVKELMSRRDAEPG